MSRPAARVNVVIPVFNLWEMTEACLASLAKCAPLNDILVTVVDNASTDATADACEPRGRALFGERFASLRLPENAGFSAACNRGAAASEAPLVFFLNNDALLTPGFLTPLLGAFDADAGGRLGAVGPLLLYPDSGRVQHLGVAFGPDLSVEHLFENFPADHPAVQGRRDFQAITAAAMLMPKALFEAAGRFHEGYQNGFEDLDLCCALRQAGKRLTVVPESVVLHFAGRSAGRFARDAHNAALLSDRRPDGFVPDLHRFLAENGFEAVLTETLDLYGRLPALVSAKLLRSLGRPFDPAKCLALVKSEPLFEAGYALLSGRLEDGGLFAEAMELCALQTFFFPTLANARHLARLAARAGNAELAGEAASKAAAMEILLADPAALAAKARLAAERLREAGDAILAALYEKRTAGGAA